MHKVEIHLICNERGELLNFMLTKANADDRNTDVFNPNRSLEKVSCHFLMTAIRKIALYMLDS